MWWRRKNDQQRTVPTVTLRPMTEDEYVTLHAWMDEDYAQDIARAMDVPIEEARVMAAKQLADLLPNGLATEGHYMWKPVSAGDGPVGDLWVHIEPARRRAFIYFIGIDAPFRGKGYGKAVMLALEPIAKAKGADHIDLNVFGDNTTAIRLYQGLGYRTTAMNMRKVL
jgi:ribosomal protein S18 acetylase RimI-like enzyme